MKSKIIEKMEAKTNQHHKDKVNAWAEAQVLANSLKYMNEIDQYNMYLDMAVDIISTYRKTYGDVFGKAWLESVEEFRGKG